VEEGVSGICRSGFSGKEAFRFRPGGCGYEHHDESMEHTDESREFPERSGNILLFVLTGQKYSLLR